MLNVHDTLCINIIFTGLNIVNRRRKQLYTKIYFLFEMKINRRTIYCVHLIFPINSQCINKSPAGMSNRHGNVNADHSVLSPLWCHNPFSLSPRRHHHANRYYFGKNVFTIKLHFVSRIFLRPASSVTQILRFRMRTRLRVRRRYAKKTQTV